MLHITRCLQLAHLIILEIAYPPESNTITRCTCAYEARALLHVRISLSIMHFAVEDLHFYRASAYLRAILI